MMSQSLEAVNRGLSHGRVPVQSQIIARAEIHHFGTVQTNAPQGVGPRSGLDGLSFHILEMERAEMRGQEPQAPHPRSAEMISHEAIERGRLGYRGLLARINRDQRHGPVICHDASAKSTKN